MMAEYAQLEALLDMYEPMDPKTLTSADKKAAMRAINLIKEKRCGTLKGRTASDGRPQRWIYKKSLTASPTVANDALMLTIMIEHTSNVNWTTMF